MPLARGDGRFEQAAELARKINRHTRVNCPLLVKKTLCAAQRKNPFVPYVGVNVQALAAIESKTHEMLWAYLVTWQCQRHHEGLAI